MFVAGYLRECNSSGKWGGLTMATAFAAGLKADACL
jgi:hypothetical protein